jgi:hypothetical protein
VSFFELLASLLLLVSPVLLTSLMLLASRLLLAHSVAGIPTVVDVPAFAGHPAFAVSGIPDVASTIACVPSVATPAVASFSAVVGVSSAGAPVLLTYMLVSHLG